jgi:hypothetical protein
MLFRTFCCGSESASASHKNPDPHSDMHKIYKLDPEPDLDPHQFADVKMYDMEFEAILAFSRVRAFF